MQDSPFFNRDLSWLEFNQRVLAQAADPQMPLLERVRFLAIFSNNLDEFFMKRMGYLRKAEAHDIQSVGADKAKPSVLLSQLRQRIELQLGQRQSLREELETELGLKGIHFLKWKDLSEEEAKQAQSYFHEKVFPILTPLAIDKAHPFPFLSNLSMSLGIVLRHPVSSEHLYARVKIPDVLPQWIEIGDPEASKEIRLLSLQDLVVANLEVLFPEMTIESVIPFRVSRSASIDAVSDDVEDRLDMVEEELRMRRVAPVVRLEYNDGGNSYGRAFLDLIRSELEIDETETYHIHGEVDYLALNEVANVNRPELRFPDHKPVKPQAFKDDPRSLFKIIRDKECLVHHPFESFHDSVEDFIREAVRDPKVLAIKMTLYRAGENNPIIPLLIRAAEKGKQVVAVIELKARFDEARNIYWSELLESAGVHVVYGVLGKKIHSKSVLVIRKEQGGYRFYSHLGTGNYNPSTAKLYTDFSLFTAQKEVGEELIEVFNYLTGLSRKKKYSKLLVAPVNMRKRFLKAIEKEIENQKQGFPAHIFAKMNSLEDREVCEALYRASQAGVQVDLLVRGFCCLRPGVPGLSENIRVQSIIGRFLEHSRIFYFRRAEEDPVDGRFYIGSADWMYRNLNNRVETMVPVEERQNRQELWDYLNLAWQDEIQSWKLSSDGKYQRMKADGSLKDGLHHKQIKRYSKQSTP